MWPAPLGAQHRDSFSSRVTEHLSALGLGLNSSPGQPSRKCVCHPLRGRAVERLSECAHQWKVIRAVGKTTPKFMSRWLKRCDCEGWSRLFFCFVFHKTNPKWIGPDAHLIHVSSHLGSGNPFFHWPGEVFYQLPGESRSCYFIATVHFHPKTTPPKA